MDKSLYFSKIQERIFLITRKFELFQLSKSNQLILLHVQSENELHRLAIDRDKHAPVPLTMFSLNMVDYRIGQE